MKGLGFRGTACGTSKVSTRVWLTSAERVDRAERTKLWPSRKFGILTAPTVHETVLRTGRTGRTQNDGRLEISAA